MQDVLTEIFGDVIHSYTRAEAIADGVLVDVSEMAREAGFRFPVAVTRAVWDEYITPDPISSGWGQSEEGRLWDVLTVLRYTIKAARPGITEIRFRVIFAMQKNKPLDLRQPVKCGDRIIGLLAMKERERLQMVGEKTKIRQERIEHREVLLKALCGHGDNFEPVITILMPEED